MFDRLKGFGAQQKLALALANEKFNVEAERLTVAR
jgi:hypothetical protein